MFFYFLKMKIVHIISDVDYCGDYNYIINFQDSDEYEFGLPIFIFGDVDIDKLKSDVVKDINNIPNLKYSVEENCIKIKYYSRCNKRFVNLIQKLLSDDNIVSFNINDLMIATSTLNIRYNVLIQTNYFIQCKDKRVHEYRYLTDDTEIKIVFTNNIANNIANNNKKVFSSFIKLKDLHTSYESYNRMRLVYHSDDDYWNLVKNKSDAKEIKDKYDTLNKRIDLHEKKLAEQINIMNKKLSTLETRTNLRGLENINIATLKENSKIDNTRGMSDEVRYIYSFICKIFNYLNDNQEELKTIILDLQEIIKEIRSMYEKLETKQNELYNKTLTPEEQKQIEEEKEQKQLEEEKKKQEEEEERKMEKSKLDAIMNMLNGITSAFNVTPENDPDMKDIMNMYSFIQDNTPKDEESK